MTIPPLRTEVRLAGTAASLLALALLVLTAERGTAAQNASRETRDRHVMITVLDKNDAPVTDLTPADVVVREDGAVREISRVSRATMPMQIVLLADDSQATSALTSELRHGLTSFVDVVAKNSPDSELSLMTFGERPTRQADFTTAAPVITRAIGVVFPRSGSGAYFLQAIIDATKNLKKRTATRPVIVAFVAEAGPEFSNNSQQNVADALKETGAALWTVVLQSMTGPQTLSLEQRERAAVIGDVARSSGGDSKMLIDKQGLERAMTGVGTLLTSQIDVTYTRPDRLVPPSKLEVTVKRAGLRVSAPHWAGQR